MKKSLIFLTIGLFLIVLGLLLWWRLANFSMPIRETSFSVTGMGKVTTASPLFGSQLQVLAFVDTKKIDASALAKRIAAFHLRAIVIDAETTIAAMHSDAHTCLDVASIKDFFTKMQLAFPLSQGQKQIFGGIGIGALLPFLRATTVADDNTLNLSVDFSATLPAPLLLCPPYKTEADGGKAILTTAPELQGQWHSLWNDQPMGSTALLVRSVSAAKTTIAPYDTPPDTMFIDEIRNAAGPKEVSAPSPSIVEVPAEQPNDIVTIFYSGDGGWRDLDRIVAENMAKEGFPVVGIDTLRDFWSRKTPEQTALELSNILGFYRKKWHAQSFVLAGYSFGADLLPIIFNKLSQEDRDSVRLVVLLAFAQDAEFEIHVSGWLGQGGGEYQTVPAVQKIPQEKIFCIYGQEEKGETGCTSLLNGKAEVLELPGGHHFDEDYQKLTHLILEKFRKTGP